MKKNNRIYNFRNTQFTKDEFPELELETNLTVKEKKYDELLKNNYKNAITKQVLINEKIETINEIPKGWIKISNLNSINQINQINNCKSKNTNTKSFTELINNDLQKLFQKWERYKNNYIELYGLDQYEKYYGIYDYDNSEEDENDYDNDYYSETENDTIYLDEKYNN